MKVAVFFALIAVSQAGVLAPLATSGSSTVTRSQDGAGNYAFGYDESHASGGSFRRESGSPGAVTGSYGLRDADGRVRTVNYIADAAGFRASISSNEPGVESKSPADTLINGVAPVIAAPVVQAAPIVAAPAIQAPVFAAPARYAAPVVQAAPVLAAPVAAAPIQGISYSSSVNHAVPARIAVAAPARLLAPAAYAPAAPLVAQAPWGYQAQW